MSQYPGFSFCVILVLCCYVLALLLNFMKRRVKGVTANPTLASPPEKLIESITDDLEADQRRRGVEIGRKTELWDAQEGRRICDEERREALKKLENAKSQLAIFSATQLEAFQVAKEIRDFVASSLPRPDVTWDNLDPVNGVAKRMGERWRLVEPWLLKLRHRYARELAPKVKKAMHRLGEEGFSVSALEPYVDGITNEADAWTAAQVLDHLAYTASYRPWVLDTQWRDTVRRYEAMTSEQYRAALDIPEFGQAVEEAINNRAAEGMK